MKKKTTGPVSGTAKPKGIASRKAGGKAAGGRKVTIAIGGLIFCMFLGTIALVLVIVHMGFPQIAGAIITGMIPVFWFILQI